jgi:segregation and condensation protein A
MNVTLEQFSGPLDLLLQMIEEEKLDITEISLAKVAGQYVAYIEQNAAIDPEEVADFLVIAARLLLIKSKTLLPYLMRDDEEEEIADFAQQLKIYKDFVEAAKRIEELFRRGANMHSRDMLRLSEDEHMFYPPPNVSLGVLQANFIEVSERLRPASVLAEESIVKAVSIEERIADIKQALEKLEQLSFQKFIEKNTTRIDVIVSFMALLELVKQQGVRAEQRALFGDISILKV